MWYTVNKQKLVFWPKVLMETNSIFLINLESVRNPKKILEKP